MVLGLSLEVHIPESVDERSVIRIGAACYPHEGIDEPMELHEAIQWAFLSPLGIEKLSALGITWEAVQTGTWNEASRSA